MRTLRRVLVGLGLVAAGLAGHAGAQQGMPTDDFLLQLQQTVDEAIQQKENGQQRQFEASGGEAQAGEAAATATQAETGMAAPEAMQDGSLPSAAPPASAAASAMAASMAKKGGKNTAEGMQEEATRVHSPAGAAKDAAVGAAAGQAAGQLPPPAMPQTVSGQKAHKPRPQADTTGTAADIKGAKEDRQVRVYAMPGMALLGSGLLAGVMLGLALWAGVLAFRRLAHSGAGGVALMAAGGALLALATGARLLLPAQEGIALLLTASGDTVLLAGAGLWLLGRHGLLQRRAGQILLAVGAGLVAVAGVLAWIVPHAAVLSARVLLVLIVLAGFAGLVLRLSTDRPGGGESLALALLSGYAAGALLSWLGIMPLDGTAELALNGLLAAAIALAAGNAMAASKATSADHAAEEVHAVSASDEEALAPNVVDVVPQAAEAALMAGASPALHDPLTGLPNERLLLERLEQALMQARSGNGAPCLIVLDIDRYRFILDTHGPAAADVLLASVAERLTAIIGDGETLARLPADQFGIIIDAARHGTILAFVQRLREMLQPPFAINGEPLSITVSLGIVDLVSVMQMSAREAFRAAEIALYEARRSGSGQEAWFTPEMLGAHSRLAQMEQELRQALIKGELKVRYQPIMRLGRSPHERRLAGFEALVRWEHPRLGLIGPEQFIDVAEELGMIGEIGRHVLGDAIRQLGIWQRTFRCEEPLFVAVNISAREMIEPALLEGVRTLLAQEQADASGLKLELTESMLLAAPDMAGTIMRELAQMGISLVCDDFGTGYSALSRLKHLPFDALKIDRSFLKDGDEASWNIVHAIVTLGHGLGLEVVAEGVEDAGQLEILEAMGCHMVQGWLLGKPLKASEVLNAMTKARRVAPLNGRLDALSAILFGEDLAPFDSARHGRTLSAALAADKVQNGERSAEQQAPKPEAGDSGSEEVQERKPPQAAQ